jgi:hypothetical protein
MRMTQSSPTTISQVSLRKRTLRRHPNKKFRNRNPKGQDVWYAARPTIVKKTVFSERKRRKSKKISAVKVPEKGA